MGMIEAIECQDYDVTAPARFNGAERKRLALEKRLNANAFLSERFNAQKLLDAIKSAEACLRLFETEGEFQVSAPGYVDGEEYAHNVRIAHIHAARQAREVLAEALRQA